MKDRSLYVKLIVTALMFLFVLVSYLSVTEGAAKAIFKQELNITGATDENDSKTIAEENLKHQANETKPTAVLLISQYRSGSSILGSLFQQQEGSFYLYEPLFPMSHRFRAVHTDLLEDSVKAVDLMVRCKLESLRDIYKHAFDVTKKADTQG